MFDSRQYEFADLTVIAGGKDITGLRGIKYTEKQEKEILYGKGNEPLSIQKGNKSYEGEITMTQGELETIVANSKDGSVLSIQLDVIVNYGNPSKGDVMMIDAIKGVQFTESPKELKQGDKFMEVTLPFIALRVKNQLR